MTVEDYLDARSSFNSNAILIEETHGDPAEMSQGTAVEILGRVKREREEEAAWQKAQARVEEQRQRAEVARVGVERLRAERVARATVVQQRAHTTARLAAACVAVLLVGAVAYGAFASSPIRCERDLEIECGRRNLHTAYRPVSGCRSAGLRGVGVWPLCARGVQRCLNDA